MFKEQFIGRHPSHFKINPLVEAFILSETFLWSAWYFVIPILAIFVVKSVKGGDIESAAFAFSFYLVVRIIVEIITAGFLNKSTESFKFAVTFFGILLTSVSYIGFAFSNTLLLLYVSYAIMGLGLGIATPAKNALFVTHIDKNKEPTEWSIYDAVTFIGMAVSTAVGGFIASRYGFEFLFLFACILNLFSVIPYILYRR
jgi:MFS family permease